jgi:hypothetical protein
VRTDYFEAASEAAEAASTAAEAASEAAEATSTAAEAASTAAEATSEAAEAASAAGSSAFLPQAARAMAAINEASRSDFFMLVSSKEIVKKRDVYGTMCKAHSPKK